MLHMRVFVLMIFLSFCCHVHGQQKTKGDTAFVNDLLAKSKALFGEDPDKAIAIARQAQAAALEISFKKGEATALKNIGIGYYFQQKYVEALDYWTQSLNIFEQLQDDIGISNLLNNIGAIYKDQGEDAKALEYCLRGLKLAEKINDKTRLMSSLTTVASIYHNKKDAKAIDYLSKALALCEELGDKKELPVLLGDLGEVYYDQKDDNKALPFYQRAIAIDNSSATAAFAYNGIGKIYRRKKEYVLALQNHNRALSIAEKVNENLHKLRALEGIANVYYNQQLYSSALAFFDKAKTLGEEIKANVDLKDIYWEMSLAYTKVSDYRNALVLKDKYADIKDSLYAVETKKTFDRMEFNFDLDKKQGEINLLTKENSLREAELQKQRITRIALSIGLGLILLIAIIIFRNYRIKARTNKILDGQKVEIENLLHNILPVQVAHELKTEGHATPRHYESVSVLFTDFKGFTVIADKMDPRDLVEELDTCFMIFDNIMEKYNLEKIKTIGDAYMCAGNIPSPDGQHVYKMIKASMEIQEYITNNNHRRVEQGLEAWELRVGIHVGPVVAGVVGKKKYAYDIWGSTVNIASRMESHGIPGKVNISAATYDLIKDRFICSHRGKIHAKNVGDIDMYLVEQEIDTAHPVKQPSSITEPKKVAFDAEILPG